MKFLTNAAQKAAEEFILKYKPVYTGLLLRQQLPSKLVVKPVDGQHVTTCFRPSDEQWLECAFSGTQGYVRPLGYANNGINEGISIAIKGYNFYAGAKVAHVTLSCSKEGKPVDTAFLPFKPIDDGSKGWKQRLATGATVQWAYSKNAALDVEATAFYGGGKTLSIKSIQEECKAYIAEHYPEEAQAAVAQAQLQAAKAAVEAAKDALLRAQTGLELEQARFDSIMNELNKSPLLKEAEEAIRGEMYYSDPDNECVLFDAGNVIIFELTDYNGETYATGTYSHANGVVYDK